MPRKAGPSGQSTGTGEDLGKTDYLYIADTKLDTTDNLLAIAAANWYLSGSTSNPTSKRNI